MMRSLGSAALVAMIALAPAGRAGEIVLVDPLTGQVVNDGAQGGPKPPTADRSAADDARARIDSDPQAGNITILGPADPVGPRERTGTTRGDAKSAIRGARDRAAGGDAAEGIPDLDPNTIIIIDDGQAKAVPDNTRLDNTTRTQVDLNKARAYQQGNKPCGSVVIGGVGEGG
ncbi:MAG: hypothetical protein HY985_16400, partial [Magnetospirillum sp.]|nr:hypothetical protein [Magnetospirillum sp.]